MKLDSIDTTAPTVSSHLCDGPGLLDLGIIPYLKLGRRVFYDPAEVRWALRKKCTVRAK